MSDSRKAASMSRKRIQVLLKEFDALRKRADEAERGLLAEMRMAVAAVRAIPDAHISVFLPPEGWTCMSRINPVGLCAYDHNEDGALDHCLFCGQPEERK